VSPNQAPTPGPQAAPDVYGPDYYRGASLSSYVDYATLEPLARRYWGPLIECYAHGVGVVPPGRALDVGCAYGFLVKELARRGWQCEGCDISEYAIAQGRARGIEGLRSGSVTELGLPAGAYRLITWIDVLEHLGSETYAATIEELRRLLAPGGVLFAATPNRIDCSGYNVFSPDWVETDATHVNYRSRAELLADFGRFRRVIVHGATPQRGQFESFRPFRWLPRPANGVLRWWHRRLLGNDTSHSAYLLLVAVR